jgi:hypothetical protein
VEVDSKYSFHFANGRVDHLPTNNLCFQWEVVGSTPLLTMEIATQLLIGIGFDDGQKFPTLDQSMQPIDIKQVIYSFPTYQQASSLSFQF